MACISSLPPFIGCNKDEQITKFGSSSGFISDVEYTKNSVSFRFGLQQQLITIFNFDGDHWLQNGMYVEVDFDQRTITRKRNE